MSRYRKEIHAYNLAESLKKWCKSVNINDDYSLTVLTNSLTSLSDLKITIQYLQKGIWGIDIGFTSQELSMYSNIDVYARIMQDLTSNNVKSSKAYLRA